MTENRSTTGHFAVERSRYWATPPTQCYLTKVSIQQSTREENTADEGTGAGAGQALEDGYILGRAVADCLSKVSGPDEAITQLQQYTQLYQDVRLPRAKRAQQTAREAGLVYQMKAPDLVGLSYDECLPFVRSKLENRMKWIWSGNIDEEYDGLKVARGLP